MQTITSNENFVWRIPRRCGCGHAAGRRTLEKCGKRPRISPVSGILAPISSSKDEQNSLRLGLCVKILARTSTSSPSSRERPVPGCIRIVCALDLLTDRSSPLSSPFVVCFFACSASFSCALSVYVNRLYFAMQHSCHNTSPGNKRACRAQSCRRRAAPSKRGKRETESPHGVGA